jgi:hypothetical protein
MTSDFTKLLKLPVDMKSRNFFILSLYTAAFLGLNVIETKKIFTANISDFLKDGTFKEISKFSQKSVDEDLLLNHLSFCSTSEWTDIPSILLLPIMHKLHNIRTGSAILIKGLLGVIENVHSILGRFPILNEKSGR